MPETQNIRNNNAHEQGIRFLSLLILMTLADRQIEKHADGRQKEDGPILTKTQNPESRA